MSPALRSTLNILLLVVQLLTNRLTLTVETAARLPSTDPTRPRKASTKDATKTRGSQAGNVGTTLRLIDDPDDIQMLKIERTSLPPGDYHEVGFQPHQVFDLDIRRV
ncbi:hypothetical protein [Methylomarinum vadi]|uniref:hypothetical protein n=1 Tax=Methylomarinum vadi TaxID=438855 RepID=UPI00068F10B1|nr:hypothetical protein [Methylomarinum vadi]